MKKIIITIIIFIIINFNLMSEVIRVPGCEYSDLNNSVSDASNGDILLVPSGNCTWNNQQLDIEDGIRIIAGGKYSIDGSYNDTGKWPTVITLVSYGSGVSSILIDNTDNSETVEISGFRFEGSAQGGTSGNGVINIQDSNKSDVLIHDIYFDVDGNSFLSRSSSDGGQVVWNVYSYTTACFQDGEFYVSDQADDSNGNGAFIKPIEFGSDRFLFVEDSVFYDNCSTSFNASIKMDSQAGGKAVVRYNYFHDAGVVWHGSATGNPNRSSYAFEFYENIFDWQATDSLQYHAAIYIRGGTAYIYNNTFNNFTNMIRTWVRRVDDTYGIFGQCDGGEVHDGNGSPTGYPCLDQPGWGKANGPTSALSDVQPQELTPIRIWNNTKNNVNNDVSDNNPTYVVEDREYYVSDDDSDMPSDYKAYPYPHPLRVQNQHWTVAHIELFLVFEIVKIYLETIKQIIMMGILTFNILGISYYINKTIITSKKIKYLNRK